MVKNRINKRSSSTEYFYVFCSFYVTRDGWDAGEILDGVFKLNRLPSIVEMRRAARTIAEERYKIIHYQHRVSIINYKYIDKDEFEMLIGDVPVDNFYFDIDNYTYDDFYDYYKKKVSQ